MPLFKIADVRFRAELIYPETERYLKDYLCDTSIDGVEEFFFKTEKSDVLREKSAASEPVADWYYESLAVFRRLCDYIAEKGDGLVFHSSALAVDGKAYLFAAKSGTGKSTHARLGRQMLGDRAQVINDDKPIIRKAGGTVYVYGTPWTGKHHLGNNVKAPLKAICFIRQSKVNEIVKISPSDALSRFFGQTIIPKERESAEKFLTLTDEILRSAKLYSLGCDISRGAAELSFSAMTED